MIGLAGSTAEIAALAHENNRCLDCAVCGVLFTTERRPAAHGFHTVAALPGLMNIFLLCAACARPTQSDLRAAIAKDSGEILQKFFLATQNPGGQA